MQIKTMVLKVLESQPETRNSDIALMIAIWKLYYPKSIKIGKSGDEGIWLKDLHILPREDHVKRHRAKIQNEKHLYLPTDWAVAKQRKINEERWREAMTTNHL